MNEIIYCIAQHPQRSMKTEHIVKILKTPKNFLTCSLSALLGHGNTKAFESDLITKVCTYSCIGNKIE